MSARRAARAQIHAARERARALQQRAQRRHARIAERQPSWGTAIITLTILVLGAGFLYRKVQESGERQEQLVYAPTDGGAVEVAQTIAAATASLPPLPPSRIQQRLPLLLIDDNPFRLDQTVHGRVLKAVEEHEAAGWMVAMNTEAEAAVRPQLPREGFDPQKPVPPLLRKALLDHQLGGLLWFHCKRDEGGRSNRIVVTRLAGEGDVWSTPSEDLLVDRAAEERE
jgi:hypothetical protein